MKKYIVFLLLVTFLFQCKTRQTQTVPVSETIKTEVEWSPEMAQKGKTIYTENCNRCHDLFEPNAFTKKDWGYWINEMKGRAEISDEQAALIYAYMANGAKHD